MFLRNFVVELMIILIIKNNTKAAPQRVISEFCFLLSLLLENHLNCVYHDSCYSASRVTLDIYLVF